MTEAALTRRYAEPPHPDCEQGFWDLPATVQDQVDAEVVKLGGRAFRLKSGDYRRKLAAALESCGPDAVLEALRWAIENKQSTASAIARAKTAAGGSGFGSAKEKPKGCRGPMTDEERARLKKEVEELTGRPWDD